MVNGLIVQKKFFKIVLTSKLGNDKIQSKAMPIKLGKRILGGKIMNREEILEKSRKENRNQDVYEKEVIIQGNRYACIAAAVLATVFFVIQIFTGGGMDYGIYAVLFAMPMAGFWLKYIKLRKKHELLVAICYTVGVVLFSAAHSYELISASEIL